MSNPGEINFYFKKKCLNKIGLLFVKNVSGICEPREELQRGLVLKFEELSRRKLTEDFEEVTSFFQGSNVKTVHILGDNDAKYPEIDDEHTRNSLASPLYLQEREASASLLQVYHSQKRKLVSRCTVNFSKYGKPVAWMSQKLKSNQQ